MSPKVNRREFVKTGTAAGLAAAAAPRAFGQGPAVVTPSSSKPVVISSANGHKYPATLADDVMPGRRESVRIDCSHVLRTLSCEGSSSNAPASLREKSNRSLSKKSSTWAG